MLTKKQKELFEYLENYIEETGIAPSFEEMKNAVKLKSKSGIHRLIMSLEQRGFIKRLKHRARAMEITKSFNNNFKQTVGINRELNNNSISIPLLGSIAAGNPIEAIENADELIPVGPRVSTNDGKKAQNRTYQDLLKNKNDLLD